MSPLDIARTTFKLLNVRAAEAATVLGRLANKRIWLDRDAAIERISSALWSSASYSYSENFESLSDVMAELGPELDTEYARDGDRYVFTPFERGEAPAMSSKLGLSYLCVLGSEKSAQALREAKLLDVGYAPLEGASTLEVTWLIESYRRHTLEVLNAFRTTETALRYVSTALSPKSSASERRYIVAEDAGIEDDIAALKAIVHIEGLPEVATHFGTNADKQNRLTEIPDNLLTILEREAKA